MIYVFISFLKMKACDLAAVWKHLSVKLENSVFFFFVFRIICDYIQGN